MLIAVASAVYLMDYYSANDTAYAYLDATSRELAVKILGDDIQNITIDQSHDGMIAFIPENVRAALIFYPGAKVEYEAYSPLMNLLAREGIMTVAVKVPCKLAFLGIDKADEVRSIFPQVERWYIGGHSLGGVAASIHVSKNADEYEGIVYLASYSSEDISKTSLKALSIIGTNDAVLNRERYIESLSSEPENFSVYVIYGGNHAYFGSYGEQKGDGEAEISPEMQWAETAVTISDWIK